MKHCIISGGYWRVGLLLATLTSFGWYILFHKGALYCIDNSLHYNLLYTLYRFCCADLHWKIGWKIGWKEGKKRWQLEQQDRLRLGMLTDHLPPLGVRVVVNVNPFPVHMGVECVMACVNANASVNANAIPCMFLFFYALPTLHSLLLSGLACYGGLVASSLEVWLAIGTISVGSFQATTVPAAVPAAAASTDLLPLWCHPNCPP